MTSVEAVRYSVETNWVCSKQMRKTLNLMGYLDNKMHGLGIF